MVHASQDLTRSTSEFRQPRAEIDDLASRTARLRVILIILMPWDGTYPTDVTFFLLMFKQHAGFVIVWLQIFKKIYKLTLLSCSFNWTSSL